MSVKKKIIIAIIAIVLIAGIVVGCIFAFAKKEENVRDMSEVVKRGSFVMSVEDQKDVLPDINKTYVFKTYEEFTKNSISKLITYSKIEKVGKNFVEIKYKAKNERYNEDYFEENDLLIVFFNESINTYEFIVNNVNFDNDICTIDVYGERYVGTQNAREERDVIYACFIENKEIGENVEASICMRDIFRIESFYLSYVNEENDNFTYGLEAYYISDFKQLESCILNGHDILKEEKINAVLHVEYNESFFNYNSLMIFIVPKAYNGRIEQNDNIFKGIKFYSYNYLTPVSKDVLDEDVEHVSVVFVPVGKSFNYDEIQYGHTLYYAWEEGIENVKVETAPVTLKAQNTESGYIKYVLKTGE